MKKTPTRGASLSSTGPTPTTEILKDLRFEHERLKQEKEFLEWKVQNAELVLDVVRDVVNGGTRPMWFEGWLKKAPTAMRRHGEESKA